MKRIASILVCWVFCALSVFAQDIQITGTVILFCALGHPIKFSFRGA